MSLPRVAVGRRLPSSRRFAELEALSGPEVIGATGDNSFRVLYGRPYAFFLAHAPRRLRLYRGAVGGGSYEEVTSGLPTNLFGPTLPSSARRFTAAFDQSARIIVAYEDAETIRVTRWSGSAYVQNVTFAGVDPALLIDVAVTDPRGYPNLLDDGWSVREAFDAGIPVLFEWLAGDPIPWLENALPDSDVLLFYLSPDRLELRVRVQRQLYATEILVHTFAAPVILDRAIALAGRYQLLVSDELGDPLPEVLISDPYLGDFLINPRPVDELAALVAPEAVRLEQDTYPAEGDDALGATVAPEAVEVVGDTAFRVDDDALVATASPEAVEVVGAVAFRIDDDALGATAAPEVVHNVTEVEPSTDANALDATASPEVIRVQTV